MNHKTLLKLTPIAASLVVAMSSFAHAAAPAATALPGAFLTNNTGVTYSIGGSAGTISNLSGNAVLQFGGASSATVGAAVAPTIASGATAATVAGFNIGASASLTLSASAANTNVLVSDLTGQASNIYGALNTNTSVASLFIANPNGIVVGASGNISAGNVALVGYQADAAVFGSSGTVAVGVVGATAPSLTTPGSAGSATPTAGGAVTVSNGATVNAGYLLVAGAGQVNVGALSTGSAVTTLAVAGGSSVTATSTAVNLGTAIVSSSAAVNLGGNTASLAVNALAAAGAVNVLGAVAVSNATIGGTLTNSAYVTLGGASNVNTFVNNANASVGSTTTFGSVTNNANLDASTGLSFGGAFANAGKATVGTLTGTTSTASVNNSGTLNAAAAVGVSNGGTLASFTNTGTLYDGGLGIHVTAGAISLGGTVAANSTNATIGGVTLSAQTGDLTGSANLISTAAASLTAVKGNVNYSGSIAGTGVTVSAATGAVALGAVNLGTTGSLAVAAGNGNITLNGDMAASSANVNATGGSVLVNKNITANTVTVTADNQIMVSGNVNAGTTGTVSLSTNKVWTGPYSLGVVVMPSGSVSAKNVSVTVAQSAGSAGNMLQYGGISATEGFIFTGNSYYQGAGAGAAINTSSATFNYGHATSGGAIAGGIVYGSANPQPSNAFFNAVMVGGSNATGGVTLGVNAANLGTAMQNVNLMGIGNTTMTTGTMVGAQFGSTGSAVINTGFVRSNLFIRAQGGNLTLSPNSGTADFYWPGLVYASTVKAGMVATVDTTKVINVGGTTGSNLSNVLPYQATGGAGIYLMTGKINNLSSITVNTNSNINVLSPLQVAGVKLYTASAPTGLVLNYSATLPAANVVSFTPPAN